MSDQCHFEGQEPLDCDSQPSSHVRSVAGDGGLQVNQFCEERCGDVAKQSTQRQEDATRNLCEVASLGEGDFSSTWQFLGVQSQETIQNPSKLQKDVGQLLSLVGSRPDGDAAGTAHVPEELVHETEELPSTSQEHLSLSRLPSVVELPAETVSHFHDQQDQGPAQHPSLGQNDKSLFSARVGAQVDGDGSPEGHGFEQAERDAVTPCPVLQEGAALPPSRRESTIEGYVAPINDVQEEPPQSTVIPVPWRVEVAKMVGNVDGCGSAQTIEVIEEPSESTAKQLPSPPGEAGDQPTDEVEVGFAPRPPQPDELQLPLGNVQVIARANPLRVFFTDCWCRQCFCSSH
ncbi:hypothetical protein MRX96_038241 [Rhipicephalus microplus]